MYVSRFLPALLLLAITATLYPPVSATGFTPRQNRSDINMVAELWSLTQMFSPLSRDYRFWLAPPFIAPGGWGGHEGLVLVMPFTANGSELMLIGSRGYLLKHEVPVYLNFTLFNTSMYRVFYVGGRPCSVIVSGGYAVVLAPQLREPLLLRGVVKAWSPAPSSTGYGPAAILANNTVFALTPEPRPIANATRRVSAAYVVLVRGEYVVAVSDGNTTRVNGYTLPGALVSASSTGDASVLLLRNRAGSQLYVLRPGRQPRLVWNGTGDAELLAVTRGSAILGCAGVIVRVSLEHGNTTYLCEGQPYAAGPGLVAWMHGGAAPRIYVLNLTTMQVTCVGGPEATFKPPQPRLPPGAPAPPVKPVPVNISYIGPWSTGWEESYPFGNTSIHYLAGPLTAWVYAERDGQRVSAKAYFLLITVPRPPRPGIKVVVGGGLEHPWVAVWSNAAMFYVDCGWRAVTWTHVLNVTGMPPGNYAFTVHVWLGFTFNDTVVPVIILKHPLKIQLKVSPEPLIPWAPMSITVHLVDPGTGRVVDNLFSHEVVSVTIGGTCSVSIRPGGTKVLVFTPTRIRGGKVEITATAPYADDAVVEVPVDTHAPRPVLGLAGNKLTVFFTDMGGAVRLNGTITINGTTYTGQATINVTRGETLAITFNPTIPGYHPATIIVEITGGAPRILKYIVPGEHGAASPRPSPAQTSTSPGAVEAPGTSTTASNRAGGPGAETAPANTDIADKIVGAFLIIAAIILLLVVKHLLRMRRHEG